MVHEAAEHGADYVKIQGLYSSEITFRERFEEGEVGSDGEMVVIQRPYRAEVERLARLDLSADDEAWFVEECRRAGTRSMITVFTLGSVERLASIGFDAVKIASYDCPSYPLLREVRDRWSRIVVSTGATLDEEVAGAAEILAGRDVSFLHCVTLYPTPLDQLHLARMDWLRQFVPSVGWSDHTNVEATGLLASKLALARGADVIERHFTVLDRTLTRDGPVSIDPTGLQDLRDFADLPAADRQSRITAEFRAWREAIGESSRPLSAAELRNRDYYAGRVATPGPDGPRYNWEER
jgi:sialic acid synthase SpsE